MPNSIDFYKRIFSHVLPVYIIVLSYDTVRTKVDAITFTIAGKLSKISSSFIYDKN